MATHPTIGVEEEFLLADPASGEPVAVNKTVAGHAAERGVKLQLELTSCQVETTTEVVGGTRELADQLRGCAASPAEAAEAGGARLLAVGLPPTVPHEFPITDTPRYREIAEELRHDRARAGHLRRHVHVAVPSREAAIRVSNRLRPWLPLLLALTANSAIYRNTDTGYASWRSVLWARWPSAGPPPQFDSVDEYDAVVQMLIRAGAMLDDGMVYWDVRPSANFPTIEFRVADVPATVAETVLLAALIRGCGDDGARRGAARATDTAADTARVAGGVLEIGTRRPRRRSAGPDREPRIGADANAVEPHGRTCPAGAGGRRRLRAGHR